MIIDTSHDHYKAMYKKDYVSDVTIQQLSTGNDIVPGYSIQLLNAYPIQVSAIELNNGSDGLLEVTVTWEYDNFKSVGLVDGFADLANNMLSIGRDTISAFKNFL